MGVLWKSFQIIFVGKSGKTRASSSLQNIIITRVLLFSRANYYYYFCGCCRRGDGSFAIVIFYSLSSLCQTVGAAKFLAYDRNRPDYNHWYRMERRNGKNINTRDPAGIKWKMKSHSCGARVQTKSPCTHTIVYIYIYWYVP